MNGRKKRKPSKKSARGKKSARVSSKRKSKSDKLLNELLQFSETYFEIHPVTYGETFRQKESTESDIEFKNIVPESKKKPLSRRGRKNIFELNFKRGAKSIKEINTAIENARKLKRLPKNKVKITFVARKGKKSQALTYLYDVDNAGEINAAMLEMNKKIWSKPDKNAKKYERRINALKKYINRIIVDFETST